MCEQIWVYVCVYICVCILKVSDRSRGRSESSLFKVYGRALLLFLDCSTLPLILTLYFWVLSKEVSSTIFKVFGRTRTEIEPSFSDHWRTLYPLGKWAGVCASMQVCIYMCVWVYIYIYIYMCVCVYVHVCMCMCVCVCLCLCVFKYM